MKVIKEFNTNIDDYVKLYYVEKGWIDEIIDGESDISHGVSGDYGRTWIYRELVKEIQENQSVTQAKESFAKNIQK